MINACKKHLEELGFDEARTVSKMEDVSDLTRRRERRKPCS